MLHPYSLAVLVSAQPDKVWSATKLEELSAASLPRVPALTLSPTSGIGYYQYASQFYLKLCQCLGVESAPGLPLLTAGSLKLGELLAHRSGMARLHFLAQQHLAVSQEEKPNGQFSVCFIAKVPTAGRSKTRLASSMSQLSPQHAAAAAGFAHRFAQASLLDCIDTFTSHAQCCVYWAMPGASPQAPSLLAEAAALLDGCRVPPRSAFVAAATGIQGPAMQTPDTITLQGEQTQEACRCPPQVRAAQCSLGTMLSVTCSYVAAAAPCCPLVLMGMDAPQLPFAVIAKACEISRTHGCAVLLPSTDGGYVACVLPAATVLAATHACTVTSSAASSQAAPWRCGSLFDAVGLAGQWSTSAVLQSQAGALLAVGVPVMLLPRAGGEDIAIPAPLPCPAGAQAESWVAVRGYIDVDTWEDLLSAATHCTHARAPRVAKLLADLRAQGLL